MSHGRALTGDRGRPDGAPAPVSSRDDGRRERGFTLVEALVTLVILTLILLSLGQLIAMGMVSNAGAEQLTTATGLATAKLEELRSGDYGTLVEGGDLDSDVADYFDEPDVDGDGEADYVRRRQITDQAGAKLVEVRTTAVRQSIGQPKQAILAAIIGEP